jgi:alkaline phosphatase D
VTALSRRAFLAGLLASGAAACTTTSEGSGRPTPTSTSTSTLAGVATPSTTRLPTALPAGLFTLGIASGDPAPGSVILWTRLAPDPMAGGGMPDVDIPVVWEVAEDDGFRRLVATGAATASSALGHSVHVDAQGLTPARRYFYRFRVGDEESPVGRTLTAPAPTDEAESMRFAFASCQNHQDGLYTAHRAIAVDDVDLVVFLGDYIYEGGRDDARPRPHATPSPADLAGYRNRYAEYKADADLQAAHAAAPWVCTFDDHEVLNNWAGNAPAGGTPLDLSPRDFLALRAAAFQAYYEHLPLRIEPPAGPEIRVHRSLDWGRLARFHVLDTRQHRDDQPCGLAGDAGILCAEVDDPARTMLGADQEAWLAGTLASSAAVWDVVAQQVVMTPITLELGGQRVGDADQWDGYPAARQRLVDLLVAQGNPVVVTGDIHAAGVGELHADALSPSDSPPAAVELVTTSISTATSDSYAGLVETAAAMSPGVRYADARHRGYVLCDVSPDRLRAEFRTVDTSPSIGRSIPTTAAIWEVAAGSHTADPA